jgi:hypothetical protein
MLHSYQTRNKDTIRPSMPPKALKSNIVDQSMIEKNDYHRELANLRREIFEMRKDMKGIKFAGTVSAQFGILTSN